MAPQFPVQPLCHALGVSRSGFYAHRKKPGLPRRLRDKQLKAVIVDIFEDSRATYGSPRIRQELAKRSEPCGKNRVSRLMKEENLKPKQKRKYRPMTTNSNHELAVAPNWIREIPAPDRPDQIWTSDITYIWTWQGWLYLASHMDLFSRKIVGWATSSSLETSLVQRSLDKALSRRRHDPGLIAHSDRGSQYASNAYRAQLEQEHIACSMSRKANCYDNAAHESFWATLKAECFNSVVPETHEQARLMIFSYIEGFYNTRRLHSSLGYQSPQDYEMHYFAKLDPGQRTILENAA